MAHIPKSNTHDLKILSFDEALRGSPGSSDLYDAEKWLYVPDHYLDYRYILASRGLKPLICIGINPSTAAPGDLDNTLKSVERIARGNGFDSFIMFNVYAQRATRPDHLDKACNHFLHQENMRAFRYILSRQQERDRRPALWAAWGTLIEKRPWLFDCLEDMIALGEAFDAAWYTAGRRSKKGHPHHPLYLRKDSPLDPFDIKDYCRLQAEDS